MVARPSWWAPHARLLAKDKSYASAAVVEAPVFVGILRRRQAVNE
jgi:hypothetical protein